MILKNKRTRAILITGLFFCWGVSLSQYTDPLLAIDSFFEGFHQRDSLKLQAVMDEDTQLFIKCNSKDRIPFREAMSMKQFISSLTSRPEQPIREERQVRLIVHQDQNLAVVWLPFCFCFDQKTQYCGYNSFTLSWNGNTWLITEISDIEFMNCRAIIVFSFINKQIKKQVII